MGWHCAVCGGDLGGGTFLQVHGLTAHEECWHALGPADQKVLTRHDSRRATRRCRRCGSVFHSHLCAMA